MNELNINKLNSRIGKSISTEEALKDVVPINWTEEILSGGRTAVVENAEKEENCIKLEITEKRGDDRDHI